MLALAFYEIHWARKTICKKFIFPEETEKLSKLFPNEVYVISFTYELVNCSKVHIVSPGNLMIVFFHFPRKHV